MQAGHRKEGESAAYFFMKNVLCASAAAMFAETCTIPADTAKVRLQIQKVVEGEAPRYNGMLGTIKTIAAEEGAIKLWDGLMPGL